MPEKKTKTKCQAGNFNEINGSTEQEVQDDVSETAKHSNENKILFTAQPNPQYIQLNTNLNRQTRSMQFISHAYE